MATLFMLIFSVFDRLQNAGKGTSITFTYLYVSDFSVVRVMLAVSVFLGLKYGHRRIENNKIDKMMKRLSTLTLGVYLLHIFVIERVYAIGRSWIELMNPICMIPMISLFTVIVCFILTWILKKLPVLGTYLI